MYNKILCYYIMVTFRNIGKHDYDAVYSLLQQLTEVGEYKEQHFLRFLATLPSNIHIICICDRENIVGMGTLMVEQKIIHNFNKVGHIEDVVINSKYKGQGYGKQLIHYLTYLAKQNKCYKVILDCSRKVSGFYEKCGYTEKNISMGIYF